MISGFFDPAYAAPVPKVRVLVFVPGFTQDWVPIEFLLDTGASSTCIHPLDAVTRIGIQPHLLATPANWPTVETLGGIGGGAEFLPLFAHYAFRHDDDHWGMIADKILIAQLTPNNQELPSLLGQNLLQHFSVTTDWPNRRIVLDG